MGRKPQGCHQQWETDQGMLQSRLAGVGEWALLSAKQATIEGHFHVHMNS